MAVRVSDSTAGAALIYDPEGRVQTSTLGVVLAGHRQLTIPGDGDSEHDAEESPSEALLPGEVGLREARDIENEVVPEKAVHGQNVTWVSAYILIISRMIGSGIFAIPGVVTRSAGSIGLSMCVWIMGALIASCTAVVALEYGCMLPRSGGDKVYLEFTYRRPRFLISTIIAIKAVLQANTANNCIVFGEYLVYGLPVESTNFARKASSLSLLLTVATLHGLFLKTGIVIQNTLGWIKIALMLFMFGTAVIVVSMTLTHGKETLFPASAGDDGALIPQGIWTGSNWGWEVFSLALYKVHYAYAGADNANNVLNEVKDPIRMLLRVIPLSLLTVCILYLLVNIAFFLVLPIQEIKDSGEMAAALFFTRLFGDGIGGDLLPILIAISIAGNVMVAVFSTARLNQEIARQGYLPLIFASSRPRKAPLGGIIINFVPAALIIIFMPSTNIYSFILNVEGYPSQLFYLLLACGLLWLRWGRPELVRPFKAWIPVVLLRVVICVALVVAPFVPTKPTGEDFLGLWHGTFALVGIGILCGAVLYWLIWAKILPGIRSYQLKENAGILSDGTTYTSIISVPK